MLRSTIRLNDMIQVCVFLAQLTVIIDSYAKKQSTNKHQNKPLSSKKGQNSEDLILRNQASSLPSAQWVANITPENIEKFRRIVNSMPKNITKSESLKLVNAIDSNKGKSPQYLENLFASLSQNNSRKTDAPGLKLCWRYTAIALHLAFQIPGPYLPARKGLGKDLDFAQNADLVFAKLKKPNGEPAFKITPFPVEIQNLTRDQMIKNGYLEAIFGAKNDKYKGPRIRKNELMLWSNKRTPGHIGTIVWDGNKLVEKGEYSANFDPTDGSSARPGGRGDNHPKAIVSFQI